uniref:Homeobox domain-containing protein n=1 Tax=Mola mola TaxID=94237 RepID=A0A3Q3W506_MOLML
MADWKTQINYNYNPAYHAYAYGLVYQPGPEQNHGNPSSWAEAGVMDLSSSNAEVTPAYYVSAARTREESPPGSPEQHAANGHCQYQSSGVLYLGDTQTGRMVLTGPHRAAYDERTQESRRVGSDSTSDSEAYISPDSWSSVSSREGSLPMADPATWVKTERDDEANGRSPDASEEVSSSLMEAPGSFMATGNECTKGTTALCAPVAAPKKTSTTAVNNPKAKVRAAFSESQMNVLLQRFSIQRYLPPAEMKNLAEVTGLTYKQVKTWFQNRRMKLRRHQKDNSWVSERYTTNKGSPVHGRVFNIPPHIPSVQIRPQEQYNQHMMGSAFKKTDPQNLALYLAAMGSTAVPSRPQAGGWSMPQGISHYEYNPNAFNSAGVASANNTGHNTSFEGKDGEAVNSRSSLNTVKVHNISQ